MINNIMNIGRYDKTNIYIHSLLKFKSKRLVYFLDGYETWKIIVRFIFVDRIKIKIFNPRRVWELSIFP